jgi:hypothetical protein
MMCIKLTQVSFSIRNMFCKREIEVRQGATTAHWQPLDLHEVGYQGAVWFGGVSGS